MIFSNGFSAMDLIAIPIIVILWIIALPLYVVWYSLIFPAMWLFDKITEAFSKED